MPYFEYDAIDKFGSKKSGMIEAETGEMAIYKLMTEDLKPTNVVTVRNVGKINTNLKLAMLKTFKRRLSYGNEIKPEIITAAKPRRNYKLSILLPLLLTIIIIASYLSLMPQ